MFLRRKRRKPEWLDEPLFLWPSTDPYTLRDVCKSIACFGGAGSGKTSGSLNYIGRAVIRNRNTGGLILISKPEEPKFWRRIFKEAGREADLIEWSATSPSRCNFIDFEMKSGGDARSLTQFLSMLTETIRSGGGGSRDEFWQESEKRVLYNAIEAVRQGTGTVSAPTLHEFITGAAYRPEQLADPAWRAKFHNRVMQAAFARKKTAIEEHDYRLVHDFWTNEFVYMDDKPRSSILAGVGNTLHTYNSGIVREMASTTTNISPASMADRKWIMAIFPIPDFGASGKLLYSGMKFLAQKFVLRRDVVPGDAVILIIADEYQNVGNSQDSPFIAESRGHLGGMFVLTQSIHAIYANMFGHSGEHQADSLLTNFGLKIFHALGDFKSAEMASSLLGQRREIFISLNEQGGQRLLDQLNGRQAFTANISESYQPVLQPREFLSQATGGPANGNRVGAIIVRSGEPFRDGERFQKVSFTQV